MEPEMLIKRPADIPPSEITPPEIYRQRRRFLQGGAALALGGSAAVAALLDTSQVAHAGRKLEGVSKSPLSTDETPNSYADVTSYNNFYEFDTSKSGPARLADSLNTDGWTIRITGEVAQEQTLGVEDLLQRYPLEERIYRLRCVEAWSMVIPWVGFPLASLIKDAQPTSRAKYVAFTTLHDPDQFPGQQPSFFGGLDWPYREGLRMDEALHPLTLLAVGLYGEVLPNQNGAPVRLVVPWKYGFKSIKSIVEISFIEKQPQTTWAMASPSEYGFYANVNPEVDHPRWSQSRERRLGELRKRPTEMFNGYAEQVASLYTGMDLRQHY